MILRDCLSLILIVCFDIQPLQGCSRFRRLVRGYSPTVIQIKPLSGLLCFPILKDLNVAILFCKLFRGFLPTIMGFADIRFKANLFSALLFLPGLKDLNLNNLRCKPEVCEYNQSGAPKWVQFCY